MKQLAFGLTLIGFALMVIFFAVFSKGAWYYYAIAILSGAFGFYLYTNAEYTK